MPAPTTQAIFFAVMRKVTAHGCITSGLARRGAIRQTIHAAFARTQLTVLELRERGVDAMLPLVGTIEFQVGRFEAGHVLCALQLHYTPLFKFTAYRMMRCIEPPRLSKRLVVH